MSKNIDKKILDATLEVIAKEKISGTRMHLIAKEANMSQSNLHYYFPTKNDLLITVMEELQKRFSEKRMESVDLKQKNLHENIHGLFEEKKDDILNHKKVDYAQFDFWVQGTVNPEIKVKFQKTFEEWRRNIEEVISSDSRTSAMKQEYAEMIPFLTVSLMMGASMQYLIEEGKFDLEQYFKTAEKMVVNFLDVKD